ncbi:MAG: DeoR/GlpR transcriptional regulator [Oligosphaeraceae bacterium]|nr:DeoR/GlpR transcriptional regulator [Oligosphaeraceae bacterium]
MNTRQRNILNILQREQLSIKSAAVIFGVSEMTIRRDLSYLSSRGLAVLLKGGAMGSTLRYEPPSVSGTLSELKFSLGEALYSRIMPCASLFIGTGSTALAFAKVLSGKLHPALTVITNALPVASALFRSSCKVILLGGELRSTSLDLVGPLAESNLGQYHVDWLVSGCDGALSSRGFFTSDFSLSHLEKKSIGIASRVAIITESRKFGQASLTCFVEPRQVQLLVTDPALPPAEAAPLRAAGIEIVFCST